MVKNGIKFFLGIIVGMIIASCTVFAATIIYDASTVKYDGTSVNFKKNNVVVSDVQTALDELNNYSKLPKRKNNTVRYAFGNPTSSSTTDYTTLNKTIFIASNGSQKSVCFTDNSKLFCFDINNYIIEKEHLSYVFNNVISGGHCSSDSNHIVCYGNNINFDLNIDGSVTSYLTSPNTTRCSISTINNTVSCTN